MLGKLENISFKGAGIGIPGIGKPEVHLTDGVAAHAGHPLNIQIEIDCL
jgi:hypothetical protein